VDIDGIALATTAELRVIDANSLEAGLDYRLPEVIDASLDPNGRHVLRLLAMLDRQGAEPCATYVRCELLAKIQGECEPQEVRLDVRLRDYVALAPPEDNVPEDERQYHLREVPLADLIPDDITPKEHR
jgi:hypothetical protein